MENQKGLLEEIAALKRERDAVILAHYYVDGSVQEIADYVGDSFYLAKVAKTCPNRTIVFCGVTFMGESATWEIGANGAAISIEGDEKGCVSSMTCIRMELGEPDDSGRRRPVEIPDSAFTMDVDTVIMALGTSPNPLISSTTDGLEVNKWKCIVADEANGKTTKEGVYAGGDAVTGAATVILAMGAGKAAAKGIDEYLSGR